MRAAMELADQCAAKIRDGGRLPPDRAELVAAMVPAARRITRAARWLNAAIEWQHQAVAQAVQTAADARADVDRFASEWVAAAPAHESCSVRAARRSASTARSVFAALTRHRPARAGTRSRRSGDGVPQPCGAAPPSSRTPDR